MMTERYWFKSSKFELELGEDEEINPGIYGRQLANWLKVRLEECGYPKVEMVEEDWGRCVVCAWRPFALWVGCGNMTDAKGPKSAELPRKEDIVWHCFIGADVFPWTRLFSKVRPESVIAKLNEDLRRILAAEPQIQLVDEP